MKKFIYFLMLIYFTTNLVGCAKAVLIKNESQNAPVLSQYRNIYVGWLDLGRDNWKKFHYQDITKWQDEMKDININAFQVYMKENLPAKNIVFAKSDSSKPEGELAIIFTNTVVDEFDPTFIHTDIQFIDLSKNREIYRSSIKASVARVGANVFSFPMRVYACVHNIADYAASKFQ